LKRFFIIILALVYLGSATGTTLRLHYCMGKLADITLWDTNSKTCTKCGMEKKSSTHDGCCKDEQKQVKLHDDHKLVENFYNGNFLTSVVLTYGFSHDTDINILSYAEKFPVSNAPLQSKRPAYLRFCVFRI